jgi:hypothetical protein
VIFLIQQLFSKGPIHFLSSIVVVCVFSENVELRGVQAGLYLVRITDGSKRMVRKINVN